MNQTKDTVTAASKAAPLFLLQPSRETAAPFFAHLGRERAAAERLHWIDFREADVEALPFDDGAFDAVVSTFGCMFAPNPKRVAAELLRACRAGGQIGLANWTPEGFVGQLFKTIGKHVPPPAATSPSASAFLGSGNIYLRAMVEYSNCRKAL